MLLPPLHPRDAPWGAGVLHHHFGLYDWRRASLKRFIAWLPSPLELREKRERLRAPEAGMRIEAMLIDDVPLGVHAPADVNLARELLA